MINIAICDDQEIYINQIYDLTVKYASSKFEYNISKFFSGEEFLESIENQNNFDIIFMDIEMQQLSGIETIKKLREKQQNAIIFFITSHSNYITDIFRLGTFQFLQKPISEEDFALDIGRAILRYERNHRNLQITTRDKIYNVKYSDILYIEVNRKQILIYTKKETIQHVGKIKEYEERLRGFGFVNIHKSYLVNLQYVERIDSGDVKMLRCDMLLPLSRNYRNEFLQEYSKYNRGRSL